MKALLFLIAVCVGFAKANAAPLAYQVADETLLAVFENDERVIDSIPQIRVIITEEMISAAGLNYLGEVKNIEIPKTVQSTPKRLWGLKTIEVLDAWKVTEGEGIVVAVSDTGIDLDHPDLEPNLWVNPKEIAGNSVDDDKNGYVDDIYGWDFVKDRPSYRDHHYHGTHVAGTIAARISDRAAGVAPKAKLMSVPFLGGSGSGSEANGAKTIIYAADNGAKIVNCSWGALGKSPIIDKAIEYASTKGVLVVAAAGNNDINTDRKYFFPASSDLDNVVSVGASSYGDYKASFSNFGSRTVDLAAPGYDIVSTVPRGKGKAAYDALSGTSMASPHTAGVAALIWSLNPKASYTEVRNILLESTRQVSKWKGRSVTQGILNAKNAVNRVQ